MHIYAMVTDQGTAMAETALCTEHYVEPFIGYAYDVGIDADDIGADTSFHDCSGNDALRCTECAISNHGEEPSIF